MAYTLLTSTVASTTVPVQLIPVGDKTSFSIKNRRASTVDILIFPFTGTLPGSPPANTFEVSPNQSFDDVDYQMSYRTDSMQSGWAAVVEVAGSCVVDAIWKL